jgi:hypothetical protein
MRQKPQESHGLADQPAQESVKEPASEPASQPDYVPRPFELAAMQAYLQNAANAPPRIKVRDGRPVPDHPEQVVGEALLMAALGTMDRDFLAGIVGQLADAATRDGEVNEQALNFMLSIVKGIKPRDQVETLLAAQMAAIHAATLTSAWRLARAETLPRQDCAERAVNKLARTFAAQTEALRRYRSGGEPNVTVQHVSVSDGGQAIVGNVTQAPRDGAPHRAAASASPAAPRKSSPARPAISPPALADAPMTPPGRPEIAPARKRRVR